MMIQLIRPELLSTIRSDEEYEATLLDIVSMLFHDMSETPEFETAWTQSQRYIDQRYMSPVVHR